MVLGALGGKPCVQFIYLSMILISLILTVEWVRIDSHLMLAWPVCCKSGGLLVNAFSLEIWSAAKAFARMKLFRMFVTVKSALKIQPQF